MHALVTGTDVATAKQMALIYLLYNVLGATVMYIFRDPILRKIEQFDQIMTEYGLWNQHKWAEVCRNIEHGIIKKETELV